MNTAPTALQSFILSQLTVPLTTLSVSSLLPRRTLRPERLSGWFQGTQPVRGSTGLGHSSQQSREPATGRLGGAAWSAPPERAACWGQEARVPRVSEGSPLAISPGEVGPVAADRDSQPLPSRTGRPAGPMGRTGHTHT